MKKAKQIEILVRGVCIKKGQLLVCQSKGAANTYLPGGHVEWNELVASGLKREIEEELGVKAVVKEFLGAVENAFIQKGERHCEINLVFAMTIDALSPAKSPKSCEDWISFKWVPLSDVSSPAAAEPLRLSACPRLLWGSFSRTEHSLLQRWSPTILKKTAREQAEEG